ncbi:protein translocase subunit SecF [Phytohabitans aurantiacus]|jgi:preprotein translocase subunit SecF|uniref:Protein-export membrane protein SecF n=1 Tax=Phytohabitans aurantiacus TaxID=3016789 RepID=A0ABQ5RB59_9ACTN|nr:protein translocase subunit SecF [Phytohabitans aurantiacus]GLI03230.1 protein-export membrane protein SecF [Phytohabitans aurantiacus]
MSGIATRLYKGEAGINVIGRRKVWFTVAATAVLIAVLSFAFRGFTLGIDFSGGVEFQVPVSVGSMSDAENAVTTALGKIDNADEPLRVASTQQVGGGDGTYLIRTSELTSSQALQAKADIAQELGISEGDISNSRVSGAWGSQVTERALLGLLVFLAAVTLYLVVRFEWRMAVSAVISLLLDLVITAGIYSLVGFEISPSTIIGFLTILGFALYDVVVVFDKVQENTRGITASSTQTYPEAANLAVNQTLMRSINTGLVALLPVGGLLFIGAFLLGAGTLRDLGLVLFVGMGIAVYSSIFFATPVLATFKAYEPKYQGHTQRVLARRAAIARGEVPVKGARSPKQVAKTAAAEPGSDDELAAMAGATPKVGSRPATGKRPSSGRGGRPGGGNRPGRGKRR